jgi:hypothetical protein
MDKYVLVTVSGIHIAIGRSMGISGYTESVLESVLPSDEELERMSDQDCESLIIKNNKMMQSVCKFLNSQQ